MLTEKCMRPRIQLFCILNLLAVAGGLTPAQAAAPRWDVVEAGAVGDGVADATAIFQKLLETAGRAGGGVVEVPAGKFRLNGHLVIPANVTLQGIFRVPPTTGSRAITNLTGSILYAYEGRGRANSAPFIQLAGNNSSLAGLIIAYPEWRQSDLPPVPYPPCVLSQDTENVGVRDCLLLNPYEGIRLVRAHRHLVRNVTGYPILRGLFVDECYDIGHIENVHFWPFGVSYEANNPYCRWINTNGVAFELARTDWHYIHNTFCFGYGVGYKFSRSAQGSANGNFLGLGADSCERAVVVDQAQPPGLLISNGEFVGRWGSSNSVCVEIGPEVEGTVSLVNCSFWGPIDRCVWMRGAAGQFTASACHFINWDNRGVGVPALQLDAGKTIVQGCTFGEDNLPVRVGSNVISAILTANQASGGFRVENQAGVRAQIALNEADPMDWTPEARSHYRLIVGGPNDGRYLRDWQGRERGTQPYRWSTALSVLQLPVVPGQRYTLTLEGEIPPIAVSPTAGLYLDGQRLAPLVAGNKLVAQLPAVSTDRIRLELRCAGWVPERLNPGSKDPRTLGLQAATITLRSEKAGAKVFNANTGGE